jgi:putative addiction module component (TIGR02574 family)
MDLNAIVEEVKKLPFSQKVDLLDELYCMLHSDPEQAAVHARQMEDLERRIEEVESGKAKFLPGEEVFERLRRREDT